MQHPYFQPRASTDGEKLDWFDDAKGFCLDAPEHVPAGSTMGRNPACPARGRTVHREHAPIFFESNPLIWAA
jgi:hypothetical protein